MALRDVGQINSTALSSDALGSVRRLRMEGAGVTAVADGAFASLQNLKNLSLNRNLLTSFNSSWFARPDALVELDLVGNRIEAVSPSMLSGFGGLRKLNLSQNRIRTIQTGSFRSLGELAELDLSGNNMTWVSPQVFGSLRSSRIGLGGNPWDCSCGAEDFVHLVKGPSDCKLGHVAVLESFAQLLFSSDLRNRSLLDGEEEVTCGGPPSLSGLPVWNVSVCATSTQTSGPDGAATTVPHSSGTLAVSAFQAVEGQVFFPAAKRSLV